MNLPTRIVVDGKGVQRMAPSVWMERSRKFSNTKRYSITIAKGDTVYGLSRKHNVPIREIIQNNNLHPPFTLKPGESLVLSNPRAHKVRKGDTLYSIAKLHSVDVSALARRNQLKPPFTLSVDQQLMLPGSLSMKELEALTPTKAYKPPVTKSTITAPKKPQSTPTKKQAPQPQKTTHKKRSRPALKRIYTKPKARTSSTFLRPLKGKIISSYGPLKNGTQNDGINIQAPLGTKVKAAENGVVVYRGKDIASYGNLVLVKHADGWVSTYAHLKDISVKRGATLKRGQVLGTVGKTGHVKTPQLHFELRKGRYPVNPGPYLSK